MPAEVIKIAVRDYQAEQLSKAALVLSEGGLVAFPTETVYGLGVNANIPSAVKRLYEVKNSPENRPFTVHLGSEADAYKHVRVVPRLAFRLMKHFWPGPLTLVLQNANGSWVGLRMPDNIIAQDLIRESGVTVIASSANVAGQPAPADAQAVLGALGDKIDVIIDAGPSKIGVSSTVVKVPEDNTFEVMRAGSITENDISSFAYKMIIFICSGNTCRSPMAMGLFRKMLSVRTGVPVERLEDNGYKVISAGTSAVYGSPASVSAVDLMRESQVDISGHISQPVTVDMIEGADQVYAMTKGHLDSLRQLAPSLKDRIKLLDSDGGDIQDPIISGWSGYRECLDKIKKSLEGII